MNLPCWRLRANGSDEEGTDGRLAMVSGAPGACSLGATPPVVSATRGHLVYRRAAYSADGRTASRGLAIHSTATGGDLGGQMGRVIGWTVSVALVGLLAGCGGGSTVGGGDHPSKSEVAAIEARGRKAKAAEAAAASHRPPPPTDTTVHFKEIFTEPRAVWPFTARLGRITENPNGLPGGGSAPPGQTYMLVEVDITSLTVGRTVPVPKMFPVIKCHGVHSLGGGTGSGFLQGSSAPDEAGFYVPLSDGRPHAWGMGFLVREGTPTSRVKCAFVPEKTPEDLSVPVYLTAPRPTPLN